VGPGGLLTDLTKTVLESALGVEMEDHLGYAKPAPEGRDGRNSRNGSREDGADRGRRGRDRGPRDPAGSFEPAIVKKRRRRR
jgi:transposase-like protein